MATIKTRPTLKFDFDDSKTGKIHRIDSYRTKNPWYQRLWKPKYNVHLLALTDKAIYDICSTKTPECSKLFGIEAKNG